MALSTILSVGHGSHEYTSSTSFSWAFTSKTFNLALSINLVEFENRKLDLLALVLDLLWSSVNLLFSLLTATTETEDEMKGGFLLDIVVGESTAILELLAGKDQTLLIWWNAFLILDFCFNIIDGIGGLNLKGDGFAR